MRQHTNEEPASDYPWHPAFLELVAGRQAVASNFLKSGEFHILTKSPRCLLIYTHRTRLNQSNLILRGTEHEASSVVLKGTLVFCLSEPIRIHNIRLRFTGQRRLGSAWTIDMPDIQRMLTQLVAGISQLAPERAPSSMTKSSYGIYGTFQTMAKKILKRFRLGIMNTRSI